MNSFFKEIRKHFLIYLLLARNCLISEMEYRFNFIMGFLIEFMWLFVRLLYVIVVYQANVSVNGLPPDGVLLYTGTYSIIMGIHTGLFGHNFYELPEHIRNGTLDTLVTKPVSLQFLLTLRKINFSWSLCDVIGGIPMVVIAWQKLGINLSVVNVIGFLGLLISGILISYSVFLLPRILSFWLIKTDAVTAITEELHGFNRMPSLIYNKWIQRIGTFIFPIFLVGNLPPMFVLQRLNYIYILWGIIAPILFAWITRLFWNAGIRNYTSASS